MIICCPSDPYFQKETLKAMAKHRKKRKIKKPNGVYGVCAATLLGSPSGREVTCVFAIHQYRLTKAQLEP